MVDSTLQPLRRRNSYDICQVSMAIRWTSNAISWEFCWADEPVPFLELARAQIGDPGQNARVQREVDEDFEFSGRELQPVTTKAGGRPRPSLEYHCQRTEGLPVPTVGAS